MNFYYIDSNFIGEGKGTILSPFRSFTELKTAGFSHPCKILIKRNSVLVEGMTFNQELFNTTGIQSVIGAYGLGSDPIWYKPNDSSTHIYSSYTQNIKIKNISFRLRNNQVNVSNGGGFITLYLPNTTGNDVDANVWIEDCHFKGSEMNRTGQNGLNKTVYICVRSDATKRVNKFGVRRSSFEDLSKGIQLQGLDLADDITDNSKGTYYSRGVKVEKCSFTGMSNGALLFNCVESLNSPYVEDEYQSVCRDCFYSSYRWDKYNGSNIYPDAVFWTYHCNRVMFERLIGGGYQPTEADSQFIDFDGMTWDSVARFIVGYGNGASLLLISLDSHGRSRYADYSSQYTESQWYNTRRNGSGNNILEFSYFFNNGVQRGYLLPGGFSGACAEIRISGFQYDVSIRNCVFIDSVSTKEKFIALDSFTTRNSVSVKIDSCAFIYKFLTTTDLVSTTNSTVPIFLNNSSISSLSWTIDDFTNTGTYLQNICSQATNLKLINPDLIFFPTQPPSSIGSALKIKPVYGTILKGTGTQSTTKDINGNTTNDIWWVDI